MRNEDLRARVVDFLSTHLQETGERSVGLTRQELADWVGVTREAATRTLRQLEQEGVVALGRGHVTVLDPARLARLRSV